MDLPMARFSLESSIGFENNVAQIAGSFANTYIREQRKLTVLWSAQKEDILHLRMDDEFLVVIRAHEFDILSMKDQRSVQEILNVAQRRFEINPW